jgi:hypothetical protein
MYMYIYIYIYIYIHTHTHTHTHINNLSTKLSGRVFAYYAQSTVFDS